MNATALIAEDEELLRAGLQAELARLWPELQIVASVAHGAAAVEQALALRPQMLFLDIRMPGLTGLEAAQALAEDWPEGQPFPLVVFVTAYDQYALQAFEHAAFDYVVKPVQADRLERTCRRLQAELAVRAKTPPALDETLARLRDVLAATGTAGPAPAAPRLSVIQASVGAAIHLVPIDEVIYFEAADKYVRVVCAGREHLIRTSLRELLPQLDPQRFWQVHRSTVVRADAIATAVREESGKLTLTLRGSSDKLVASRLYAHLFKAM
ncbi:MAG TPA: LytTR family DNA-binding domain-containing protein [Burkholderiaceae bacterium]|jgi:DNA-binding LytR/AlgR family response regulator|nr:LytTR family DNA-binding domain-containing protein [Burkholderiaceae bacterium]